MFQRGIILNAAHPQACNGSQPVSSTGETRDSLPYRAQTLSTALVVRFTGPKTPGTTNTAPNGCCCLLFRASNMHYKGFVSLKTSTPSHVECWRSPVESFGCHRRLERDVNSFPTPLYVASPATLATCAASTKRQSITNSSSRFRDPAS